MFDHKGNRKYLNEAERRAFLRIARRDPDDVNRALFLVLFHTGCRISEALNLTAERVDLVNKTIVLETLKRRKRGLFRSVPIPESLVELLRPLLVKVADSARIWTFSRTTAFRSVKACMEKAAISGAMAAPKGLRHGFAVACLAREIPLPIVQKWLGHARMETTAIYLAVSGNEERQLAERLWKKKF